MPATGLGSREADPEKGVQDLSQGKGPFGGGGIAACSREGRTRMPLAKERHLWVLGRQPL